MKRVFSAVMALVFTLAFCASAFASTAQKDCALVVNGARVSLNAATGYIRKSGSAMMVPVQTVLTAASVEYTFDQKTGLISFASPEGKKVELKKGAKTMRIGGKASKLRVKTEVSKGIMTADVRFLASLNYSAKNYKNSKALRAQGYKNGALALARSGGSLTLPSSTAASTSALPAKLEAAAEGTSQIVGVKYSSGSKATLTYYSKGTDGNWLKQYSASAYVGKKGIGKTKEGDKKTPTGTFSLSTPFGIKADPGAAMGGYLKVTNDHYWSGQNGAYYNQLVDVSVNTAYKPTKADEHLIDYKGVYNYCLLIGYNASGTASKGSAIFLHCKGSNAYTAGCIAVAESVMVDLLKTLNAGAKIVIY